MHRWLAEAFVHVPLCVDPILDAGRRHVMPVLRRSLPAARLAGRTPAGDPARVLVIDRRLTSDRLCRGLFEGAPVVEWSGRVPLTGLRAFVGEARGTVDIVLANVPAGLPAFLRPAQGVVAPGLVHFVLAVEADREAQYRLANSSRRTAFRRCHEVGYGWRVGNSREEIRHFIDDFYRPHVVGRFGDDVVLHERHVLERHAYRGGGIHWLLKDGRALFGRLFRRDGDRLRFLVVGKAADAPKVRPSPEVASLLLAVDFARERCCRTVDMGGTPSLIHDGLLQFKSTMGATALDHRLSNSRSADRLGPPDAGFARVVAQPRSDRSTRRRPRGAHLHGRGRRCGASGADPQGPAERRRRTPGAATRCRLCGGGDGAGRPSSALESVTSE